MRSRISFLSLAICTAAATSCGGRNLELEPGGVESGSGGSSSQSSASTTATQSAAGAGDAVTSVGAGAADAASAATAVAVGSGGNGSTGNGGASSSGGGSDGSGGRSSSNNGAGGGFDPVQCFECVAQRCPEVLICIQDPRCSQGLACVAQQCLTGGNPDPVCLAGCYENPADALEAVQVISCVLGGCGGECAGVLGALPGG